MNMNTDMERTVVLEGSVSSGSRDFAHSIIAEAAPSDRGAFDVSRSRDSTVSPEETAPAVLHGRRVQPWLALLTVVGLCGVLAIALLPLITTDIVLPQRVASLGLLVSVLLCAAGVLGQRKRISADESQRALELDGQRIEAQRQRDESKRINDANQAAILRLMNELQLVAEGDLTQQATVTEDITGAIADSVNYTVEELRTLVAQVQGTVSRVTETTQMVDLTSTELLAASSEQLREIRDTGESVLQMAGRINEVSAQAQQTAQVARQSLSATESGLRAVQDTIGGMHAIRDHIQETSKRIKRLGESSQEIGEITELISDITEQTNVLALNAAIQAASAGEAGRGFSVVAQEVQRLAERSADATRQIAALVKAIQTDTQDAVAAMERSTQGVVEGTRLTDKAGSALGDIDRVSRELADLIMHISSQALGEAQSANVVATNIQHIFAVTEQTGEGTRSTAQMVRELSHTAEELKQSVARFKID
jgi:twitching motility protein PilJ